MIRPRPRLDVVIRPSTGSASPLTPGSFLMLPRFSCVGPPELKGLDLGRMTRGNRACRAMHVALEQRLYQRENAAYL